MSSPMSSSPMTRSIFLRWPFLPSSPRCSRSSPFRLPFRYASHTSASTFTKPRYHTTSRIYDDPDAERDAPYQWPHVWAEPLAEYRTGGYHSVHLGDTMQNGRYRIVHKLGFGCEAKIWLAKDSLLSRLVAIKICKSELCHDAEEEGILQRLAHGPANHAGKEHVIQLSDSFKLLGPNGCHSCLVTDALGPSIDSSKLSPKAAWEVSKQLVEATAYMHEMVVVHGDIRPQKFLFRRSTPLQPEDGPGSYEYWIGQVETIDGSALTAQAPRYHISSYLADSSLPDHGLDKHQVKLIGSGGKILPSELHGLGKDFGYRAPEFVLDAQLGPSAYIWSLGLTIFELVNREGPFAELDFYSKDDFVNAWISVFGYLPKEWKRHTPVRPYGAPEPREYNLRERLCPAAYGASHWFSKSDIDSLGDLLVSMTQYRPSDRPTASDVLKHPWFQCRATIIRL